jgi:hypothetical protein
MRALVGLLLSALVFGGAVFESANTHWSPNKAASGSPLWEMLLAFALVVVGLVLEVKRPARGAIARGLRLIGITASALWAVWLAFLVVGFGFR